MYEIPRSQQQSSPNRSCYQQLSARLSDRDRFRVAKILGGGTEVLASANVHFMSDMGWRRDANLVACIIEDLLLKYKSLLIIDTSRKSARFVDSIQWSSITRVSSASPGIIKFNKTPESEMFLKFEHDVDAADFLSALQTADPETPTLSVSSFGSFVELPTARVKTSNYSTGLFGSLRKKMSKRKEEKQSVSTLASTPQESTNSLIPSESAENHEIAEIQETRSAIPVQQRKCYEQLAPSLDVSTRTRVAALLGDETEVLAAGNIYLTHDGYKSLKVKGVVCIIEDHSLRSLIIINTTIKNARILKTFQWSDISIVTRQSSEVIYFGTTTSDIFLLFLHELEAQYFLSVLKTADTRCSSDSSVGNELSSAKADNSKDSTGLFGSLRKKLTKRKEETQSESTASSQGSTESLVTNSAESQAMAELQKERLEAAANQRKYYENQSALLEEKQRLQLTEGLGKILASGKVQLLLSTVPMTTWTMRATGAAFIIKDKFQNVSVCIFDPSSDKPFMLQSSITDIKKATANLITFARSDNAFLMGLNFECEKEAALFYPIFVEFGKVTFKPVLLPPPSNSPSEMNRLAELEKQKQEEIATRDREIVELTESLATMEREKPQSSFRVDQTENETEDDTEEESEDDKDNDSEESEESVEETEDEKDDESKDGSENEKEDESDTEDETAGPSFSFNFNFTFSLN